MSPAPRERSGLWPTLDERTDMADATCSVDGCERPVRSLGWCNMHHQRWLKHGDPTITKRPTYGVYSTGDVPCSHVGCDRAAVTRNLCDMHYQRLRLHGTTDPQPVVGRQALRRGDVALVPLSDGRVAVIDVEDAERVERRSWTASVKAAGQCYAYCNGFGYMHRLIINAPSDLVVDHIDGDGLNNRKSNLRLATQEQNTYNAGAKRGRYKGVHFDKRTQRWRAQLNANGHRYHLGRFDTEEEAAQAYDAMAKRLHGEFVRLNMPNAS